MTIRRETCWNVVWPHVEKRHEQEPKMRPRARKEASAQEVQGYNLQFAEAKHTELKSCIDNDALTSLI